MYCDQRRIANEETVETTKAEPNLFTAEESRAFASTLVECAGGLRYLGETFYADTFIKSAEVINSLCDEIERSKEKGEGKEKPSPHTPYKEKGKREEKTTTTTTRACARACEGVFEGPTCKQVTSYSKRVKIDADYALWWFSQMSEMGWCNPDSINEPIGNWKQLLRSWWFKRAKAGDDWKKPVEAPPRKYSRDEWCLCEERCSHFDARACRCRVGCCVPPAWQKHPIAPEECVRFDAKAI